MVDNKSFVGEKFNDWEVIGWESGRKGIDWICRCKCGFIKKQKVDNIKSGRSKMCKKCYGESKRKEKKHTGPNIVKLRYNNHLEWSEENTFEGTYEEYLKECKIRREEKEQR